MWNNTRVKDSAGRLKEEGVFERWIKLRTGDNEKISCRD